MKGFPENLYTRQDYLNAVAYVRENPEDRELLLARLKQMKASTTRMELKEAARSKPAERQHQEDYEPVTDPGCERTRLGFTEKELDCLTGGM